MIFNTKNTKAQRRKRSTEVAHPGTPSRGGSRMGDFGRSCRSAAGTVGGRPFAPHEAEDFFVSSCLCVLRASLSILLAALRIRTFSGPPGIFPRLPPDLGRSGRGTP